MAIQITRGGQEDRLRQAGAIRVFADVMSGRQFERPGLSALVDHARPGDSLCIIRLGRSLKELLETVENLKAHDIHLAASKKASTRPRPPANWCFMSLERSPTSASAHLQTHARRYCGRQKTRQEARSPATRPGDRVSRANPCRGWIDTGASCETTGHWQGNGLQDRQGGTPKSRSRRVWS